MLSRSGRGDERDFQYDFQGPNQEQGSELPLSVTFSSTYLINVTLLDTATTNGCINNGLITFTDSPARNSNSLSALPCMPKTLGPNNQHCVWSMGMNVCICSHVLSPVKCTGRLSTRFRALHHCVRLCAQVCVCECQIILARIAAARGRPFVSNQTKWRAVDLPRIFLNLYLFEMGRGQLN